MTKVYYCYSCGEYFKVKESELRTNPDSVRCPNCEGDDTEYSPEENTDDDDDDNLSKDYYDYGKHSIKNEYDFLNNDSDDDDF